MTKPSDPDISKARLLRTLAGQPMSMEQAQRAAQLLGVHWTTVYRLRKRYTLDPVTSSIAARPPGPKDGSQRISSDAESAITVTLTHWLPRQKELAHPLNDITMEVKRLCRKDAIKAPSRHTI